MIKHGLQIFACNASRDLAGDIAQRLGLRLGQLEISRFSNDNLRVQIQENVRERDVFVVQSFTEPVSEHIMELLITLDALRSASAQRITAVIGPQRVAMGGKIARHVAGLDRCGAGAEEAPPYLFGQLRIGFPGLQAAAVAYRALESHVAAGAGGRLRDVELLAQQRHDQ